MISDRDPLPPTSCPHLVPNAPTVVPMSLRYHSALRSSQKLFQTRRHSLQESASAQFKLDAKARRATLESPFASSSSLSLPIRRSHSTHLLFPGLEDIFLPSSTSSFFPPPSPSLFRVGHEKVCVIFSEPVWDYHLVNDSCTRPPAGLGPMGASQAPNSFSTTWTSF